MKVYDKVKQILEKYPECRNNDKELIWTFLAEDRFTISRYFFMQAPSFESITRVRRNIQKTHPELQAIKKIKEARKAKQKSFPRFLYE